MSDPIRTRSLPITRFSGRGEAPQTLDDLIVTEEPLEIRVDGEAFAVLMRTPGDDRALVAGFLHSEGVVDDVEDLVELAPCADPNREHRDNIMQVRLATGVSAEHIERARRRTAVTASCGICGKTSIEAAMLERPALRSVPALSASLIGSAGPAALATQDIFAETGGLHGAVLFQITESEAQADAGPVGGRTLQVLGRAEDVGRHNAVDKVIGQRLLEGRDADGTVLWLSGRAGFEVVQKALMAGIGALVAVGAPTSLAVELATEAGMTLIGFARGGHRFNVYAGEVAQD